MPNTNLARMRARESASEFAPLQNDRDTSVPADQPPQRNRLLAAMPAEVLALLEHDLRTIPLAQGALIFEAGEQIEQIWFPQSGLISRMIVTKDGNTVETSIVGREGAVGLHRAFGERRSFTRANIQVSGTFTVVPANRFEQVASESPALRDVVAGYTELLWAEAQQLAACNAVHDAAARLCRWLLQIADRIESNHLPLTQEFLAQMLGVRRTTVTLLAQALQKKGLIRYSRGHIAILDHAPLAASACECYQIAGRDRLPAALGVAV